MIFTDVIRALTDAKVRFVVVGGVAAGLAGSTRATFDLDICYDPAGDNVEKLARGLAGWHAYLRGVEPGLPFFMDAKAFRITPVMTLTTDPGPVHVMDRVEGIGTFEAVVANSVVVDAPGVTFRALGLPALVKAKRTIRRKKDLEQLPELEALLARVRSARKR
jgi:predicted nucleotidyltransferase